MKIVSGKNTKIFVLLVVCFLAVCCLSLSWGEIRIPLNDLWHIVGWQLHLPFFDGTGFSPEEKAVLWYIRMPRTLVGIMTGAALAVSGTIMQGIFGNPLAAPGITGVSSGAAAGAVVAIALGKNYTNIFLMPFCAFVGAMSAVAITLTFALKNHRLPIATLLLAGVAVSMILGALTSTLLTFIHEQELQNYLFWMIGGLHYRRWEHVRLVFWPIMAGLTALGVLSRHLNLLALGEIEAQTAGMPVVFFRLLFLSITSMVTASAVCVSGNIGFVGLVGPHITRMLVGSDHRTLLPASALVGSAMLVFCDTLGRMILAPAELRVGIITALLGAPYFLYLLRKTKSPIY